MKILVLSDTHSNITYALKVIENIKDKIDCVIHLGDMTEDVDFLKSRYEKLPFYNVRGNCDYDINIPSEKEVRLGGKRLFLTHGNRFSVKYSTDRLFYYAFENEYDAVLYGHTHIPNIEYSENVLVFNPGSITLPRQNNIKTYGILDITDNIIRPSIVGLYGDTFKIMNIF